MGLDAKSTIEAGKAVLGIEFGSTRIKAVLVAGENKPIASGSHEWENQLENGIWTYSLDAIWAGLQDCYRDMTDDVKKKYGVEVESLAAIGFSAMMHGYMAFNKDDELLVPFRTLEKYDHRTGIGRIVRAVPVPHSAALEYRAPVSGNLKRRRPRNLISHSYLRLPYTSHWKMTGCKVAGVGEASGMFPIDIETKDYNARMMAQFEELAASKGFSQKLSDIFPKVLLAGEDAGTLTEEGAKLLDVSGKLKAGIPICPPEGDAGTGMAATNSVAVRTGNVSAGTSVFAMLVLEKDLKKPHEEIDLVTTPDGNLVAMVHCNNCTSDLNAWVGLFKEFAEAFGVDVDMNKLFGTLYNKALEGDKDCGGLLAYNYFSGEHVTGFDEGRPLFVRTPNSKFNLANFMRVNLYTSLGALKVGLDILLKEEDVKIDRVTGHGGLFKTKGVGQSILAAAMNTPISVMETAGEGGAWGIALLASYMVNRKDGESLDVFLNENVFKGTRERRWLRMQRMWQDLTSSQSATKRDLRLKELQWNH